LPEAESYADQYPTIKSPKAGQNCSFNICRGLIEAEASLVSSCFSETEGEHVLNVHAFF